MINIITGTALADFVILLLELIVNFNTKRFHLGKLFVCLSLHYN